ncbi:MAG: HEAT repeat domain-containing protein [Planctomycetes bacterium]|nr:HEAT repeat domain-containing protein [Planctomycetota bacterium]
MRLFSSALIATVLLLPGCVSDKRPKDPLKALASQDPKHRVEATFELAKKGDRSAIPSLVQILRDDDVSVRYFACIALVRLTGQRFGFHAYAPEPEREAAVREWEKWLKSQSDTARAGDGAPPETPGGTKNAN